MSKKRALAMKNVLFVTWDGPSSTYLAGLFLPIFRALADRGFRFHVLQFGWGGVMDTTAVSTSCAESGVPYRWVAVWRRPVAPGSLATAIAGIRPVRRAIRDWSIDLVMPRSYLPALAAIPAAKGRGLPVLLDADGLPNDERLEFAGGSSGGVVHRLLSALERYALRNANAITVRTARAAEILGERSGVARDRFTIVANARNSSLFRPLNEEERKAARRRLGVAGEAPLLVYAGTSLGGKYRGDLILDFFRLVHQRRPDSRLLLVMPDPREDHALFRSAPELAEATVHASATPAEVPALVGAADLGLSLIRATPSMQAASAVKTGEYLLCGVPVLASSGVGGIETILDAESGRCMVNEDGLESAAEWFCGEVLPQRDRFSSGARRVGLEHFSLDRAIPAYESALRDAIAHGAGRR